MYTFKQKIKTINSAKDRLSFFFKYESSKKLAIDNLNYFNSYLTLKYPNYNSKNKNEINFIAQYYVKIFKDYRSYIIKTSKKKDLIQSIINVNNRMIADCQSFLNESEFIKKDLFHDFEQSEKRRIGNLIMEKIYYQKDEYIRSFESISEGVRAWDCLVSIVEDGTVGLNELPSYGIDIEGISIE